LSALQNLQVYVTGITLTTIDTGYVGVGILNSQVTLPITGVVGGVVSIGNVPTVLVNTGYVGVSVLNTPSVNVANVPTVLVNTGYIGASILNTPNVNVANTPNVNVANTPTVLVGSTVNVSVVNTPNVNVANTPTVLVGSTVNATIVGSTIQVPVQIQSSLINVPITGVVGVNTGVVANAGAYTVLDQVVYSNTTFYTASPPSTTYSSAINVVPYESASVLFNVTSLLGTGVTVSLNAYFPGLGINYTLASQTLTSPGQALLTASVLPFNYVTLGVTIYGSTVVLSAELVAKP